MTADSANVPLTAPKRVVEVARQTMGAIDLDAYGDSVLSPMIGAREFYSRDASGRHLHPGGKGRVLMAVPGGGLARGRKLAYRLLADWSEGSVEEALFWTSHNEIMRQCPWIFDAPLMVCIPFRRLSPRFLDDGLDLLRPTRQGSWDFMVYFPRLSELAASRARFIGAAGGVGRVIEVGASPIRWEDGYRLLTGNDYFAEAE